MRENTEEPNKMINVTKTYLPNIKKFKAYIDKIFKSNWVSNNGPLVQELEKRLKEYLGVKNMVLVANGTLALQIAYKALALQGEVITTPFSFVATTSSLVWEGLRPIFVDIDRETLCIDPDKIGASVTKNCSAIVPVHVFGNACEVKKIQKIADRHGLKIVYDASHAFGIKYKDKSLLNYGDISTLSFHATKIFHTCEGGALIIKDDELYYKAKKMLDFGITGPDAAIGELGINAKMNELEAAMGLCVLDDIGRIIEDRERAYRYYYKSLSKTLTLPKWNKNSGNNYSYFPVVFESERKLLKVKVALNREGIYPRRYFYPSLDSFCYLNQTQKMPISRDISHKILCLPLYANLTRNMQSKIIRIIHSNLKNKNFPQKICKSSQVKLYEKGISNE